MQFLNNLYKLIFVNQICFGFFFFLSDRIKDPPQTPR